MGELARKTVSSSVWATIEKVANMGVGFVIGLVLARLLTPGDYGVMAMFGVFTGIASQFVDCGFGTALVRKKECSQADFSTCFWFNFVVGIIMYLALFFSSPFIADFYNMPILIPVIRVYSLNLLLSSTFIVQSSILSRQLAFKKIAEFNVLSSIFCGVIGIAIAYAGGGVWALVFSGMANTVIYFFFVNYYTRWKPSLIFSKASFKYLWSFGSRMLVTGFISNIYSNIYNILIGKFYSAKDLGLFNKGQSMAGFGPGIVNSVLGRILLPILSKLQSDRERMTFAYRQYSILGMFVCVPIVFGVIALARPFVSFFLTDKWLGCVIYIYLFAISSLTGPTGYVNLMTTQAMGRSDLTLQSEVIKKVICFIVVAFLVRYGVLALAIGSVVLNIFIYFVNLYYGRVVIGLGYWVQVKDTLPYIFAGIAMMGITVGVTYFIPHDLAKVIVGTIVGIASYYAITKYVMKVPYYDMLLKIVKERFHK